MKLLAVTPLGRNRETPRLWIESRRLEALGFPSSPRVTTRLTPVHSSRRLSVRVCFALRNSKGFADAGSELKTTRVR
jgi:hypothetical protein